MSELNARTQQLLRCIIPRRSFTFIHQGLKLLASLGELRDLLGGPFGRPDYESPLQVGHAEAQLPQRFLFGRGLDSPDGLDALAKETYRLDGLSKGMVEQEGERRDLKARDVLALRERFSDRGGIR